MPTVRPERPKTSFLSLLLALVLGAGVLGVLFLLTQQIAAAVAVAAVLMFFTGFFHYIVWGWWLSPLIRRDVEAEEDDRSAE